MNLSEFAARFPGKPAQVLGSTGESVTYAELNRRSLQFAHFLRGAGMRPGDVLAFQMQNNLRLFEMLWGALRSGLYCAQVEAGFESEKVAHILNDSAATLFVTDFAHRETAAAMIAMAPGVQRRLMIGGEIAGYESFERLIRAQRCDPLDDEPEGRVINYSGGTTGMPKAVKGALSGRPFSETSIDVRNRGQLWGYSEQTVQLCAAPTTRLLMAYSVMAQRFGGTVIINDSPDPLRVLEFVERYHVTHLQALPMWFLSLSKAGPELLARFKVPSLEYICHAGAPCPGAVKSEMMDYFGPIIHEYYSGSEGAGMTYIAPDDWLANPGSVGRAIVGTVHIVGPGGDELPPGSPGAIYFEGGPKFAYHNLPDRTAQAYDARGWATLGDAGYLDERGYLYYLGRVDDRIEVEGRSIYPQAIENELVMIPEVGDIALMGSACGQVVVLVELSSSSLPPDLSGRLQEMTATLADLPKGIVTVHVVPSLHRPLTGKLNRKDVRRRYADLLGGAG